MLVLSNNVCGCTVGAFTYVCFAYTHSGITVCLQSQRDCCLLALAVRLLPFTLSAVCLSDAESGAHLFVVVEMMFHSFDFLIRFVSFSCNEDDIAGLCQCGSGANGFATVGDGKCFGASCFV